MRRALEATPSVQPIAPEGFESFYRSRYTRLAQAVFLLVRDEGEAEDIAQEAFARVFAHWPRVSAMASPEGYLYRTALNVVRKRARRTVPRTSGGGRDLPDPAEPLAERDRILRALGRLSASQREAVVLVDWLDMATEDAARTLRVKPSSVRVRLHRARAELRKMLGGADD